MTEHPSIPSVRVPREAYIAVLSAPAMTLAAPSGVRLSPAAWLTVSPDWHPAWGWGPWLAEAEMGYWTLRRLAAKL